MSCYQTPKWAFSEQLFNEIKSPSNKYKYNPIWIGGDFNLPDIDWETKPIIEHQYPTVLNKSFLATLDL